MERSFRKPHFLPLGGSIFIRVHCSTYVQKLKSWMSRVVLGGSSLLCPSRPPIFLVLLGFKWPMYALEKFLPELRENKNQFQQKVSMVGTAQFFFNLEGVNL